MDGYRNADTRSDDGAALVYEYSKLRPTLLSAFFLGPVLAYVPARLLLAFDRRIEALVVLAIGVIAGVVFAVRAARRRRMLEAQGLTEADVLVRDFGK